MKSIKEQFEHYLQGHIHPDVQPAARRITHPELGRISMEAFLDVAGIFQANHEAFDAHNVTGEVEGVPVLERTNVIQADFRTRVVDL